MEKPKVKYIINSRKFSYNRFYNLLRCTPGININPEDIVMTKCKGDATDLTQQAIKKGYNLIVSLGGDGTINEISNGIMISGMNDKVKQGIISKGGGEDISMALLGTTDTKGTLEKIADYIKNPSDDKIKNVDIGYFQSGSVERYFVNTCSVGGIDTNIIRMMEATRKIPIIRNFKPYKLYALLSAMFAKPMKINEVMVNDEKILSDEEILMINFLNSHKAGGGLELAPGASMYDGKLDVVYLDQTNFKRIVELLKKLETAQHIGEKEVHHIKGIENVVITTKEQQNYQLDGEHVSSSGSTKHTIEIKPSAISFVKG